MPTQPFPRLAASYVVLSADNVDTDQIIPARFLKTTERSGLGSHLFNDWRYDASGAPKADFPLNAPGARGAAVLVAGHHFGCGSSREHAVWALMSAGFKAVVSTSFGDIFRGNALGNGLLPIEVDDATLSELTEAAEAGRKVDVDLPAQQLTLPSGRKVSFPIPPFAKHCMHNGIDELDVLLEAAPDVTKFERAHPAAVSTIAQGDRA